MHGTCEEDPEVPSPPMKMCLLPGNGWKGQEGRPLPPSTLEMKIYRCKAYERCMPIRPDEVYIG